MVPRRRQTPSIARAADCRAFKTDPFPCLLGWSLILFICKQIELLREAIDRVQILDPLVPFCLGRRKLPHTR